MNKTMLILMFAVLLTANSSADLCIGTTTCEVGVASCSIEFPPGGSCGILYGGTHVICIAKNAEGVPLGSVSDYCPEDPENGLGDLPILNPENCDVSMPLYWLYCTGFPAY